MKISKKKLKQIDQVSFVVEVIKNNEPLTYTGDHWTDFPPDEWIDSQKELWDSMFELEQKIKSQILKILIDENEAT